MRLALRLIFRAECLLPRHGAGSRKDRDPLARKRRCAVYERGVSWKVEAREGCPPEPRRIPQRKWCFHWGSFAERVQVGILTTRKAWLGFFTAATASATLAKWCWLLNLRKDLEGFPFAVGRIRYSAFARPEVWRVSRLVVAARAGTAQKRRHPQRFWMNFCRVIMESRDWALEHAIADSKGIEIA